MTIDQGKPARTILIVEDEWLIADEIEIMIRKLGFEPLGPVPRVKDALALLEGSQPNAAILDISLDRHYSFPVAEILAGRGIPFMFLTGHSAMDIPSRFRGAPMLQKPVTLAALAAKLHVVTG